MICGICWHQSPEEKKYSRSEAVKNIWKFYKFNLSLFASFYHVFAVQAFESNGRVSVTVMDGEEMVGQMAEQVGLIIIQVSSFLHSGDLLIFDAR